MHHLNYRIKCTKFCQLSSSGLEKNCGNQSCSTKTNLPPGGTTVLRSARKSNGSIASTIRTSLPGYVKLCQTVLGETCGNQLSPPWRFVPSVTLCPLRDVFCFANKRKKMKVVKIIVMPTQRVAKWLIVYRISWILSQSPVQELNFYHSFRHGGDILHLDVSLCRYVKFFSKENISGHNCLWYPLWYNI